ncbi:replication endonuclease [Rheinheimera sp.]|uniref:replication endonuclease n=1 Tax=Rheinheimera sp. TaxID=1869214 RepID=UPI002631F692|nr:replication endonuclease [Rheinheimera sp.]MCA1930913.1 replication endonuclease [Rheinheimera sp.]
MPLSAYPVSALSDWRWSNELVDCLPARYERTLISTYTSKYQKDDVAANVWLRLIMGKLKRIKMPLTAISTDTTATSWASECFRWRYTSSRGSHITIDELIPRYKHLAAYAKRFGFVPPGADRKKMTPAQISQCVAHLDNEKWWQRQAKKTAARAREYMAIALGMVGRGAESYISKECLSEWVKQQKDAAEFLENNFIAAESETANGFDDLDIISLSEAAAGSTANPEIRRLEMMARIRGMKEAAEAAGHTAIFVTITAPGAYHYNSGKKWNGSDPRDTQRYLSKQWAKVRAELSESDIKISGLRVVEPHNDETPHWHMLLFVLPDFKESVIRLLKHYALQHDRDEKGAEQHRFTVEEIDPAKGCAVAYIAKYISKSINASHVETELDNETGEPIADVSQKCRAWASRWGIRQFQFIGSPPVTVWRELRRIREPLTCEKTEAIREAADKGQFCKFVQLMGGLNAPRSSYPVNTIKHVKETASGTVREKIVGIIAGAHNYMITRRNWISLGNLKGSLSRFCSLQGANRAARTRENNCKSELNQPERNEHFWNRFERAANELAEFTSKKSGFVAYINAAGEYITEKITDYFNSYAPEPSWDSCAA